MNSFRDGGWPTSLSRWRHSDFREVNLTHTRQLYLNWIDFGKLDE